MTSLIDIYENTNIIVIPNNIDSKLEFLQNLLNYKYKNNNYKFEKYYNLFEFIVNYIIINYDELYNTNIEINNIIYTSNLITG
jgi:hypothetical protein